MSVPYAQLIRQSGSPRLSIFSRATPHVLLELYLLLLLIIAFPFAYIDLLIPLLRYTAHQSYLKQRFPSYPLFWITIFRKKTQPMIIVMNQAHTGVFLILTLCSVTISEFQTCSFFSGSLKSIALPTRFPDNGLDAPKKNTTHDQLNASGSYR